MKTNYTLFIANKNYSSWSLRAWVLLRELGIPFEERLTPFPESGKHEQFRAFSPTGRVPCLHDADRVVWDTLAIAEYVAERHPGVWPESEDARAWARCAAAEMHSGFAQLRERCAMNCGVRVRMHEPTAELRNEFDRLDELWSEGQQRFGGPFLAGSTFGAVDAFFVPVAFRIRTYGIRLGTEAMRYAAGLLELESVREWDRAGLAERWRDPSHEAEVLAAGECIEDLRSS